MKAKSDADEAASRLSLAAAIRHVLTQLVRLLEEEDPSTLMREGSPLALALESWRKTVTSRTAGVSTQRARELERAKLENMARAAQLQKERDDLDQRNKELLNELVKQKKKEETYKQGLLDARFSGTGHQAEAKQLDLEVRELRRRVRELEGGPPLTAVEAAPKSKSKAASESAGHKGTKLAVVPSGPSVQDRRAAAEAAFNAMWKPKPGAASEPAEQQQAAGARSEAAKAASTGTAGASGGRRSRRRRGGRRRSAAQRAASEARAQVARPTPQETKTGKAPAEGGVPEQPTVPKAKVPEKAAPKKAAPKKAAPKKAASKKAAPKKAAPKKAASKKAAPKKAAPKKAAPKKAAPKKVTSKKAKATKTPAKKVAVTKPRATKAVATKARSGKATVKQAASTSKSAGSKNGAKKRSAAKSADAKPTPRRSATKKSTKSLRSS